MEHNLLCDAIMTQNLEEVMRILQKDPLAAEGTDEYGRPFSFLAARTGNLSLVRYFVEYSRASMDERDKKNRTILHYAAASGERLLIEYLTERVGLNPFAGDINLITPYDVAAKMGHKEVTDYFERLSGTSMSGTYRNPIRTGMFPDPSIVRVGEDFYMVNSSFIYFPCIPISHSRDLIHWKIIGHAITNKEWAQLEGLESGRGYWAPDISWHNGKFYITATYRLNDGGDIVRRQIVVSSEKPEGPYGKPVFIDEDGIDPSLFWEDDGRCYMLLNRGARIFELNHNTFEKISEAFLLYYGDQKRAPEGPHLLKYNGWYYLFLAEGGTGVGHRITVSRSKTLMGIYEPCPFNPIMKQADARAGLQRCGHGKPVQTQKGQWYMVYLCGRMFEGKYTILGRETALDPITWTADDWPMVNNLKGPSVVQRAPDIGTMQVCNSSQKQKEAEQEQPIGHYYRFGPEGLGCDWVFPRPPEEGGYRVKDRKVWLSGSRKPLSSIDARNVMLRRQTSFCFSAETCMVLYNNEKNSIGPDQDGGMICYYDENTWLKFGVFGTADGKLELKVIEHIGETDRETRGIKLTEYKNSKFQGAEMEESLRIFLQIETDGLRRRCSWRQDEDRPWQLAAELTSVNYLCDEGISRGKRFTGAMTGMYVYAGEKPAGAAFEFFYYCDQVQGWEEFIL